MPTHDLDRKTIEKIKKITSHFPEVESVILFGSRAENTNKATSDYDLAIKAPTLDAQQFVRLHRLLNDAFLYEIDVVHLDHLQNQRLIENIKETGIKL